MGADGPKGLGPGVPREVGCVQEHELVHEGNAEGLAPPAAADDRDEVGGTDGTTGACASVPPPDGTMGFPGHSTSDTRGTAATRPDSEAEAAPSALSPPPPTPTGMDPPCAA